LIFNLAGDEIRYWGGWGAKYCGRLILDAILYVVRGGIAWRQLPVEFPPASTLYGIFVRAGVGQCTGVASDHARKGRRGWFVR
jgi:transposase